MFVCLSKTLTWSEVRNTVVPFSQIKILFCQIQNVLSNRANFLEKNDTFKYRVNILELKTSAPSESH